MGKMGEIFRAHAKEYRRRFGDRMSSAQLRTMRDIEVCHTSAAGTALSGLEDVAEDERSPEVEDHCFILHAEPPRTF